VGFIAFGFVVARFSIVLREVATVTHTTIPTSGISAASGSWLALVGVLCACYGGYRYVATARALRSGITRAMPDAAAIGGAIAVALIGFAVALILVPLG
jgi:uncharacterized membrane protein YidH (DUF202 family)